jgi:hypothetical protein
MLMERSMSEVIFENLITPEQYAKAVGVSTKTIVNRLGKGHLPGFKEGKRWFMEKNSIEEYFRNRAALSKTGGNSPCR